MPPTTIRLELEALTDPQASCLLLCRIFQYTGRTRIIGPRARALELPLLVLSGQVLCLKLGLRGSIFAVVSPPLSKRRDSGRHSVRSNYSSSYSTLRYATVHKRRRSQTEKGYITTTPCHTYHENVSKEKGTITNTSLKRSQITLLTISIHVITRVSVPPISNT